MVHRAPAPGQIGPFSSRTNRIHGVRHKYNRRIPQSNPFSAGPDPSRGRSEFAYSKGPAGAGTPRP
jgi:hypothetical protein